METFICECCELEQLNTLRASMFESYMPPTRCRMCNEHQGKPQRRTEDHDKELRRRLSVAISAARDAHNQAAESHRRKNAARLLAKFGQSWTWIASAPLSTCY